MSNTEPHGERLQKVLSRAGVASRRQVEAFLLAGRIAVNGEVVTELGRRVNPAVDVVALDGRVLQLDVDRRYVMVNKPAKMVTSMSDEKGRRDLSEFVQDIGERLFPVGRLDYDTTGLLLLTNDGDAAQVLAHPSFGVEKTYVATVKGTVTPKTLQERRSGVELEDGPIAVDNAVVIGEPREAKSIVEITLHSGRNRIVRRLCEHVGHPVVTLQRRRFGPFHLGGLKQGTWRDFTPEERHQLATLVELAKTQSEEGHRGR
jgi:23S rRNA pseudouridine2605 synthase/16S rRNA pseudouridine516 synthase